MAKTSVQEKILLFFILALALTLRLWGIHFGLPGLYHADEPIVLNHALAYGAGDFNPHFFKIPPLVSYLLFGVFGIYYAAGKLTGFFNSTSDFESLFLTDPSSFYALARILFGAMAGTLTVYLFYRIIRDSFGALRALTAAFLLSVCFLHVTDSHYLYADIPLLLVFVAAFGVFWRLSEKSSTKHHMAAGAMIGAAAAVKYNGIFAALAYAACLFFLREKGHVRFKKAGAAFLASAVTFTLLNPYWLFDFHFFVEDIRTQAESQGGVGWAHHFFYSLPGAVGWPVLIAAFAGVWIGFKYFFTAQDRKRWSLLIFTAGYYGVLAGAGQPYPRYVLPLLPGILFFAADALAFFSKEGSRRLFFAVTLALLSVFPLAKSILWDHLMAQVDTRDLAKHWIEQTLPRNERLALDWEFYMPRLNFSTAQLEEKKAALSAENPFADLQHRRLEALLKRSQSQAAFTLHFLVPDPENQARFLMARPVLAYNWETLAETGIRYALLLPGNRQLAPDFFNTMDQKARLVKDFSPYRSGRLEPIDEVTMTGGPFTWKEILARERNGQAIQVYELKSSSTPSVKP